MILTIVIFLLILTVLVIIHELGHFLVAKKFGIKVEEFGFGFPPRLFGIKKGETLYSINALPIGGFVKLFGEDEAGGGTLRLRSGQESVGKSADLKRAFFARPASERAAVVVAGVVMNVLLAIIIFYAFLSISNFKTDLLLLGDYKFFGVKQTNYNIEKAEIISAVSPNSPAQKAGMKPPIKILSANDTEVTKASDFIKIVNENKGKTLMVTWQEIKTGVIMSKEITPRSSPPKNEGPLGVGFFPFAVLEYESAAQKVFSGIAHPYNLMSYNLDIMRKIIVFSFEKKTAEPIREGVAGPVGIATLVGAIVGIEDAREMVLQLLNLAGILSISLAFFNVLPIPALDGGRLFFILIEMVIRRKVSQKFEAAAHAVGFAILMALVLLITFNDIIKLLPR